VATPARKPSLSSSPSSTASMSTPSTATTTTASSPVPKKVINTGKQSADAHLPDDRSLIDAVRDNSDPTDWVLYGYESNSNKIVPVGSGSGGIDELSKHFDESSILYGLLRVIVLLDGRPTTKFVYIIWVGESVPIRRKALITTHKGAVTDYIGQHHINYDCSTREEVTKEAIMKSVSHAAGTASHVKD